MQKTMADKAAPKKSNPFGGMKGGGCTKKMAGGGAVRDIGGTNSIGRSGGIPTPKNANRTGGDLSGKLTKSSTGEGVEKGYKPNTKIVKATSKGRDGIAQRGRTKPQASKEM